MINTICNTIFFTDKIFNPIKNLYIIYFFLDSVHYNLHDDQQKLVQKDCLI